MLWFLKRCWFTFAFTLCVPGLYLAIYHMLGETGAGRFIKDGYKACWEE